MLWYSLITLFTFSILIVLFLWVVLVALCMTDHFFSPGNPLQIGWRKALHKTDVFYLAIPSHLVLFF